jgi:hypothetical protein
VKYIAKKIIILFLSYLSIQNSQSQIQKGTWCVGLNYANNYVFSPTVGTKGGWSSVIEFPNVGYFITNRIFVGVSTSIHVPAKNIQILFGDAIPNVYSVNPNVRLYFGQNKLKLFTQAQYRFGRQNLGKYDARTATGTIQTYESIN